MGTAIFYKRVSTGAQDGASQIAACEAYAAGAGLEIVATYEDVITGASAAAERAGLVGLLEALAPGDTVLVERRDRLGRDALEVAYIERTIQAKGARIVTASGLGAEQTPEAQLIARMLDLVAEYEKALNNSRTKAALDARRAKGLIVGQPHYGYAADADGFKVEHAGEQATISRARELRAGGARYKEVKDTLTEEGHRSRRGAPLSLDTLRKICAGIEPPKRGPQARSTGRRPMTEARPGLEALVMEYRDRGWSQREISAGVTEAGYTTGTGGDISAVQVGRILRRAGSTS
jgi:putative DNA-invertase from lambdoid prophage Rac